VDQGNAHTHTDTPQVLATIAFVHAWYLMLGTSCYHFQYQYNEKSGDPLVSIHLQFLVMYQDWKDPTNYTQES